MCRMIGIGSSAESSTENRMLKKAIFSPAQPRRAETRLTQVWFSARQNPQRSPEATPPVFSRLRPRWMAFLSILLFLTFPAPFSEAQLDRLRRSKALEQPSTAETSMIEIPEGLFTMGFDGTQALEDERPKHQMWLPAFFMDLHEVTTAQYTAFLAATNRLAPWQWNTVELSQHSDRPVIGVDWWY